MSRESSPGVTDSSFKINKKSYGASKDKVRGEESSVYFETKVSTSTGGNGGPHNCSKLPSRDPGVLVERYVVEDVLGRE